jgi:hypothetical protein
MRKAMNMAFRGGVQEVTCSRHLKENVSRYLQDKVGVDRAVRRRIIAQIFGDGGLANENNMAVFDTRAEQIVSEMINSPGVSFADYCKNNVIPLLRKNAAAGRSGWTSNNSESINAELKQATQWRPRQLPELIDLIKSLVTAQHKDAERAMFGAGIVPLDGTALCFLLNRLLECKRTVIDVFTQQG